MPEQNLENLPEFEIPQSSPEKVSSPEKKTEQQSESNTEQASRKEQEKAQSQATTVTLPDNSPAPKPLVQSNEIILQRVESILSEGMDRAFLTMDIATQAKFKAKGEETAKEIMTLLQKTKVKTKQVLKLILDWLRIIPGVNKFYIEQEAKIKTDRILRIHEGKD